MTTVAAALAAARSRLRAAGVERAPTDARLLLGAATALDQSALLARPEAILGHEAEQTFGGWVERRLAGEPVARILGVKEFWGLPFRLGPETLEPRPDTEILVEEALREARRTNPAGNPRICDLGTGTGAILVALVTELPQAQGVAVDLSAGAVEVARQNAERLGVAGRITFHIGDFTEAPGGPFDLVVSNPPYVETGSLGFLPPEVRSHDPRLALDGGADGLDAYRLITGIVGRLLRPGGSLLLEVGMGQAGAVVALCSAAALHVERVIDDLSGIPRVVVARQPS